MHIDGQSLAGVWDCFLILAFGTFLKKTPLNCMLLFLHKASTRLFLIKTFCTAIRIGPAPGRQIPTQLQSSIDIHSHNNIPAPYWKGRMSQRPLECLSIPELGGKPEVTLNCTNTALLPKFPAIHTALFQGSSEARVVHQCCGDWPG